MLVELGARLLDRLAALDSALWRLLGSVLRLGILEDLRIADEALQPFAILAVGLGSEPQRGDAAVDPLVDDLFELGVAQPDVIAHIAAMPIDAVALAVIGEAAVVVDDFHIAHW